MSQLFEVKADAALFDVMNELRAVCLRLQGIDFALSNATMIPDELADNPEAIANLWYCASNEIKNLDSLLCALEQKHTKEVTV